MAENRLKRSDPVACFWLEAGLAGGGGHLVRAAALAHELARWNIAARFFAADPGSARRMSQGRLAIEPLDHGFAAACAAAGAAVAIVDLPHIAPPPPAALQAVSERGICLVTFDSADPGAAFSDILVHMVAQRAEFSPPRHRVRYLLGPRYLVLRPGLAAPARKRRTFPRRARRLIVGFGASDPLGLTARAVEALLPAAGDLEVDILLGPLASPAAAAALQHLAAALPRGRVHRGIIDPTELLLAADIGLFAFGMLYLEASVLGLPALLWHVSPEHRDVAGRFYRHCPGRAALDLGTAQETPAGAVAQAVWDLARDQAQRRDLSRAAARAVDGGGAARVARAIAQELRG